MVATKQKTDPRCIPGAVVKFAGGLRAFVTGMKGDRVQVDYEMQALGSDSCPVHSLTLVQASLEPAPESFQDVDIREVVWNIGDRVQFDGEEWELRAFGNDEHVTLNRELENSTVSRRVSRSQFEKCAAPSLSHEVHTPIPGIMVFRGDSRNVLPMLEVQTFDSVVTSVPHWSKISYLEETDPLKDLEMGLEADPNIYLDSMAEIFSHCFELTKPGGALVLDITDTSNNESPIRRKMSDRKTGTKFDRRRKILDSHREKEQLTITDWLRIELMAIGWLLRREIIWVKLKKDGTVDDGFSRADKDAPTTTHQKLLYFIKPEKANGREYAAYYHDVGGGTVWFAAPDSDPTRTHPCPMPLAIADKAVRMTCPVGGRVLDPFLGSGTTLLAAAEDSEGGKRQGFGIELSKEFAARACDRLIQETNRPVQKTLLTLPASMSPVGMCPPSDRSVNMTKAFAPTGWVEEKGSKKLFRYKSGKKKPSMTLESRAEEVLARVLCFHRIYHQDVKRWLASFRGNKKGTLLELRSILPAEHLGAIERSARVDIEVQEILEELGIR
jgi:site-specific DNA-methyltransferase (adenine-specific)